MAKLEEERLEAAEELEEAIAGAKLATVKLQTARENLGDEQITELEKTTQNSIKEGEKVLKTGGQTEALLELAEYLKELAKGLHSTAAAYEDPENRESIEKAVKLRQEKEETERLKAELEKQQAAALLAKQSSEEPSSEESSSFFGRAKQWVGTFFSSSPSTLEVEMGTFVDSEMSEYGFHSCFDEEQLAAMELVGQQY